jgi:AcrR family transcriptional regulator
MKTKRAYVMRSRADAVTGTRRRILQAAFELSGEKLSLEIVLADVAQRAGVSVQTILRHFGSREALFEATTTFAQAQIVAERAAPAGDVPAAVQVIFSHYEARGDAVLRLLGQELWDEQVKRVTDRGRHTHRAWVQAVFAPQLAAHPAADREALTDLLVVATDVYTWKLLRRDKNLDRKAAERRVRRMIAALLAAPPEGS